MTNIWDLFNEEEERLLEEGRGDTTTFATLEILNQFKTENHL